MKRITFFLFILLTLAGCTRKVYIPVEGKTEVREVERIVSRIDTVTVYVDIPAQSQSVQTRDSVSFLETDFAVSMAAWSDGILTHTLDNKPQKLKGESVVVLTDTIHERDSLSIVYVPQVVVPEFSWWQKLKMEVGGIAIGIILVLVACLIAKYVKR